MSPSDQMTAAEVIAALNLSPHPEKGYYIETFRDSSTIPSSSSGEKEAGKEKGEEEEGKEGRPHSTCIYYLLEGAAGVSHWHRVRDAVEVWHHYAGAPLRLSLWRDPKDSDSGSGPSPSPSSGEGEGSGEGVRDVILGTDLTGGERPQAVVQRNEWQHAVSLGDWTLVGCTVAPAFVFDSFEMAPAGWEPGDG